MHNKYGSVLGVGGVKLEPGSARACIVTVTAIQTDDQPDAMALQASRRLRHRRGAAWPAAWSDRRQPLIGYVPRQKAAFEIRPSSHGGGSTPEFALAGSPSDSDFNLDHWTSV
jgi:hypothetical protein